MNADHSLHSACLYRLHQQRLRQAGHRTREAAEDTEARLRNQRLRQARLHARETPEHTAARLQDQRLRQADLRAGEDAVQTEARLQEQRIRQANLRERETAAACAARLHHTSWHAHIVMIHTGVDSPSSSRRSREARRRRAFLLVHIIYTCTTVHKHLCIKQQHITHKHIYIHLYTTHTHTHAHMHAYLSPVHTSFLFLKNSSSGFPARQ